MLIKIDDDDEWAFNTSGCPLPGVEIRVVDAEGKPLPSSTEGRLFVRCCSNFGGYLNRPHLNNADGEGWFDTGDLAEIDHRGYVRITGLSKDVIIRGGENVPVVDRDASLQASRHQPGCHCGPSRWAAGRAWLRCRGAEAGTGDRSHGRDELPQSAESRFNTSPKS